MKNEATLTTEANLFCSYIVGKPCPDEVAARYVKIINSQPADDADKGLAFFKKHPWSLGLLDAGLAFLRPTAELRRRIYVMFAVLESTTTFSEDFLPKKRQPLYFFVMTLIGLRAAVKAVLGIVIIKVARLA